MADVLTVTIDTAQPRIKRERITATAAGLEWNGPVWSDTWITPENETLCLRPAPLKPEWHTTTSGIYSRLGLADFASLTDSNWSEKVDKAGSRRIYNQAGMDSAAACGSLFGVNRGWFVGYHAFNLGNQADASVLEIAWTMDGSFSTGPSFRFWNSGKVDVYEDAVYVATYTLGNKAGTAQKSYCDFLIIPMRRREILVYSITSGDAFVHVLSGISESEESPVIIPDAYFVWWVPTGSVDVEIAPVQYPTTGYATSDVILLANPPASGAGFESWTNNDPADTITLAKVFGDSGFSGTPGDTVIHLVDLVKEDGSTAFVADGSLDTCRLKATLTGNGEYTPFLYYAHKAFEAEVVNTNATETFDLTPYMVGEWTLEVPDDPGGVAFRFTITTPDTLDGGDVPLLKTLSNRPVQVKIGSVIILDGVTMPPKYTDSTTDESKRLEIEVRDRMHTLQTQMMRERMPLDGFDFCKASGVSAISFWFSRAGYSRDASDMDLDDVALVLGQIPSKAATDFSILADVGAKPYDQLDELTTRFAAGWLFGIVPQGSGAPKPVYHDPAGLPTTPDYTLYRSDTDAVAASADPEDVYMSYSEVPLEIEANEVWVTGVDPRTGKIVRAYDRDDASQNPATAPSSRADNWVGEIRYMGVIDGRYNSEAACADGVASILPLVSARHFAGDCDVPKMLFKGSGAPVWRGDMLELDGARTGRVTALSVRGMRETSGLVAREAKYTIGPLLSTGGRSAREIRDVQQRRSVNKLIDSTRTLSSVAIKSATR